jgi:hypothetical protein
MRGRRGRRVQQNQTAETRNTQRLPVQFHQAGRRRFLFLAYSVQPVNREDLRGNSQLSDAAEDLCGWNGKSALSKEKDDSVVEGAGIGRESICVLGGSAVKNS